MEMYLVATIAGPAASSGSTLDRCTPRAFAVPRESGESAPAGYQDGALTEACLQLSSGIPPGTGEAPCDRDLFHAIGDDRDCFVGVSSGASDITSSERDSEGTRYWNVAASGEFQPPLVKKEAAKTTSLTAKSDRFLSSFQDKIFSSSRFTQYSNHATPPSLSFVFDLDCVDLQA